MEKYAFEYAQSRGITDDPEFKKCFQYEGHDGKIHMKDLFDMMSGTSTGSIISAGLSYPKDTRGFEKNAWIPMYWGFDIIDIYSNKGEFIFKKKEGINKGLRAFLMILYMTIFAGIGFYLGRRWFDNPEQDKIYKNMHKALKAQKRIVSGEQIVEKDQDIDFQTLEKNKKTIHQSVFGYNFKKFMKVFATKEDPSKRETSISDSS